MRKLVVLSLVLLASAVPAAAQRTTGSLVGTVQDESGSVLPGVVVSVKGPTVVGAQTTTTNESGFYRFAALPPGPTASASACRASARSIDPTSACLSGPPWRRTPP